MASEKVYVGKAGAQELYTRVEGHIDARIPKVPGAEGNVGKFTEDGSLEDTGVSAAALESAVQDDHTHENKEILDATTAAYTTEEQVKLSGIAEGAQANVIETITVDDEPLTPSGKNVNIDLTGKVDKEDGKGLSTNDYTNADKGKLGAIEGGAQVNVIETVEVAGTALAVIGKTVNVPYAGANVNGVVKLTDDPESVTENTAASPAAIRAALANFGGFMVVELDPETGKPDVEEPSTKYIYLTKEDDSGKEDPYTEWIYVVPEQGEPHWDVIGTATVDLSGYVQKVSGGTQGDLAGLAPDGGIVDSGISGSDVSDAVAKLAGIDNYVERASVSGRTLTLTPKSGEAVEFTETGDVNTIESISVNSTAVQPDANKNVNIVIPKAVPDPVAQNQMLFSTDGVSWAPVAWEMEYFNSVVIGGRRYNTVKIGDAEWLAENLDFAPDGIEVIDTWRDTTDPVAMYYTSAEDSHEKNIGLMYDWYAAKYLEDNKATLFPGWHVPTKADFDAMDAAIPVTDITRGYELKAENVSWAIGWGPGSGRIVSGFNALPGGRTAGSSITGLGDMTQFISITTASADYEYIPRIISDGLNPYYGQSKNTSSMGYIRLVKDSV